MEDQKRVAGGLVELGVPRALAQVIAKDDSRVGARIYLLDNSGSMGAEDGCVLKESGGKLITQESSRWDEVKALAKDHARWNFTVGTPCEFTILNSLGQTKGAAPREGHEYIVIDPKKGGKTEQLAALDRWLEDNEPRGTTPLADRLDEIRTRLTKQTGQGRMLFLTIVTDGLPTTHDSGSSTGADQQRLVKAIRDIMGAHSMQLVIRLCTSDEDAVKFYEKVDREIELPTDIVDDFKSEALEIKQCGNDWFCYTPLIHRLREAGTLCKVLDSIDEKKLGAGEARKLAAMLCDVTGDAPDDKALIKELRDSMQRNMKPHFNILTQQMQPIVDLGKLTSVLGAGGCLPCCNP